MRFSTTIALGLATYAAATPVRRQAMSSVASVASVATSAAAPASSSASRASSASSAAAPSASASSGVTNGTVPIDTNGVTDLGVLQFALALEKLEISFYRLGLKYDQSAYAAAGYDTFVRQRFTEIIAEEQIHVATISETITQLGGTPNQYCNYSFPQVTDVKSFLMTAQMINGVGPGAYTGAAALLSNKSILTTSAQILSVEARHNAWVTSDVNKGDAFPQTFQVPLTAAQALTVASPFIASCPANNTALIVTSAPSLAISPNQMSYSVGQTITLRQGPRFGPPNLVGNSTATFDPNNPAANTTALTQSGLYAVFLNGNTAGSFPFVPLVNGTAKIPAGTTGQSYVVVVNSSSEVTTASTVAGPQIVNIPVPAMDFTVQSNPAGRVKQQSS